MAEKTEGTPELRRMVEEIGLGKLMEISPRAIEKAVGAAARLKAELPSEFALSDEPAHVYRAGPEA